MCSFQHHKQRAGYHQYMVRRRNEERYVLYDELLPSTQGYGFYALLRKHRFRWQEYSNLLRSVWNRKDYTFYRS